MNLVLRQLKQHIRCKMCAQVHLYRRTYMFSDGREWCWIHRSFCLVRIHVSQRVCVEKLWTKGRLCINFTQTDRQMQTDRQTDTRTDRLAQTHTNTGNLQRLYPSCLFSLCQNQSVRSHSYENVFLLQDHFHANQNCFHMKGFAWGLILKEKRKVTRKWPVYLSQCLQSGMDIKYIKFFLLTPTLK